MSTMNISPARRAEIVRRRTGQPARLWHQQRVCPRIDPQGQGPPATARLAAGRRDFRADQARRRELFRRIARPHPTKHEIGRLADMSAKPIIPRTRAEQDIDEAITHYLMSSARAASGFVDALEAAYRHIARHPASGSSRYAHELDLPDLRSWPLSRYPFLVSTSNVHNTSTYGACFIPGAICRPGCRNQVKRGCPQAPLIHPTTATTNYGYSKLGKRGPHGPASSGDQFTLPAAPCSNWASSVEPVSAVVEDWPPSMVWVTASK